MITANLGLILTIFNSLVLLATAIVTVWSRNDLKELAVNTNSIKDALVASTAKASFAEGKAIGIEIGTPSSAVAEVAIVKAIPLEIKVPA